MFCVNLHTFSDRRDEQKKLNKITLKKTSIKIENIRDFNWGKEVESRENYLDKTYNLSSLKSACFIVVPFGPFNLLAHLMVQFSFEGSEPVILSIEARRGKKNSFTPIHGLFGKYGLIYTWGTPNDLIGLRKDLRKNKVYMYEFDYSHEELVQMLTHFAKETNCLYDNPKYYNTFWANCMTKLWAGFPRKKRKNMHRSLGSFFYAFVARDLRHYGFLKNTVSLSLQFSMKNKKM